MTTDTDLLQAAHQAEAARDAGTARARYNELLAAHPRHAEALGGLARLELAAGRASDALGWLNQVNATQLDPQPLTEHCLMLAAAHRALQHTGNELRALKAALAADAYCWPALLQMGQLLERQGQPKVAARTYADVIKISPPAEFRPAEYRQALEHAEQLAGMYAEALEVTLLQTINELPGMTSRWREAVSIMAGRTKPYHSDSNQLCVPRLPAQPFFRREMFDWVPEFEKHTAAIRSEMIAAMSEAGEAFAPYIQYQPGEPVNQWGELNHSRDWTGFHLYRGGEPVEENLARCPATAAALKLVDAVHLAGTCPNAMFSVLAPKTRIPPHHGESNARLVAHLPLVVPDNCLFRVGYDNRRWTEGEVMVFDDTIEHEAMNDSDQLRVVLIFDVWNPLLSLEERAIVQAMAKAEREFRKGA